MLPIFSVRSMQVKELALYEKTPINLDEILDVDPLILYTPVSLATSALYHVPLKTM
jgi:hypothetical protein